MVRGLAESAWRRASRAASARGDLAGSEQWAAPLRRAASAAVGRLDGGGGGGGAGRSRNGGSSGGGGCSLPTMEAAAAAGGARRRGAEDGLRGRILRELDHVARRQELVEAEDEVAVAPEELQDPIDDPGRIDPPVLEVVHDLEEGGVYLGRVHVGPNAFEVLERVLDLRANIA